MSKRTDALRRAAPAVGETPHVDPIQISSPDREAELRAIIREGYDGETPAAEEPKA